MSSNRRKQASSTLLYRLMALGLLGVGSVHAHIPLTPTILNDALIEIEQAQAAVSEETESGNRAAALYVSAVAASKLTTLLNQEVQLHGFDQKALLDAAVARALELGAEIIWSEDHEQYFYTGDAYRQYLAIVPNGIEAANSRYQLIELGFYLGSTESREEQAARAAVESDFLRVYPEFGNAERVAMFLAIDYRDLWRLCSASDDRDCAEHYAKLNREHLDAVAARYADGRTGELARTLLQRFEAEIANAQ
jgi:hypothetical protein